MTVNTTHPRPDARLDSSRAVLFHPAPAARSTAPRRGSAPGRPPAAAHAPDARPMPPAMPPAPHAAAGTRTGARGRRPKEARRGARARLLPPVRHRRAPGPPAFGAFDVLPLPVPLRPGIRHGIRDGISEISDRRSADVGIFAFWLPAAESRQACTFLTLPLTLTLLRRVRGMLLLFLLGDGCSAGPSPSSSRLASQASRLFPPDLA